MEGNYLSSWERGEMNPYYIKCNKCGKILKVNGDEFIPSGQCKECQDLRQAESALHQAELAVEYHKQKLI